VEEYLNLYHQKLWEIAYENLIRTFFHLNTIILFVLFLSIWYFFFGKKRILLFIVSYFSLFLFGGAVEYVNSYDKIMSPDSIYNKDGLYNSLIPVEIRLPIEYVDEQPLSSVDGELKKADVILLAVSAPRYNAGLFSATADFFSGEYRRGKSFLVALVGYEEKDGEWQSVDIRIAPGVGEKDFQKFSKVLHIKKDEAEGATGIILDLQKIYKLKLRKEKDGHW
jgi:hypothetical protein